MNEPSSFDDEGVTPGGADELSSAVVFPWPPREGESVVEAFVETWKGASLHPSRFFSAMPAEERLGPALLYYLIVGIVVAAINLFWRFVLPRAEIDAETVPTAMAIAQSISPLVEFLLSPLIQIAVQEAAENLSQWTEALIAKHRVNGVLLTGPAPCAVDRIRGRWRWHLLLRSATPRPLGALCREIQIRYTLPPGRGELRFILDRDPVSLL